MESWFLLFTTLALFVSAPSICAAQVMTNITATTGAGNLGTSVNQVGNSFNITGGTRPGGGPNLFHSFGNFNVGAGDVANFLNTTPNIATSNILGRVTGGNISNIFGTIQTTSYPNANLFLMNPSGFVFGPTAALNVGGAVSFTTAQYIRLFDGVSSNANFYANPGLDGLANSILAIDPSAFEFLSASPAAYGFLSAPSPNATITVQGSALSVPSGQSISLVGGKIVIQGAALSDGTIQKAQLSAPNGKIQLATAASPGEFDATTLQSIPNVNGASFSSFGSVSMEPGSSLDVSGTRTVFIKGGQLVLSVNDAMLSTSESPAQNDTILLSPGSTIVTSNSTTDPGADVQITVGNLTLDGATVSTINTGDVNGGNVSINATAVALTNGGNILSSTGFDFTSGVPVGSGNGGNVTIQGLQAGNAAESITLSGGGAINMVTFGPGRGGDTQLTAGTLTMENGGMILTATIDGGGVGGDVVLNVGTASLSGGSSILSQSQSPTASGQGGNVTIRGLQGPGSAAELVSLSSDSSVLSQSLLSGDGGAVTITSSSLTMDGAATTINSSANDVGGGGNIVLNVQQAKLSGGATIATLTVSGDLNAQPGPSLTMQGLQGARTKADSVVLTGSGSGIVSDSSGIGRAGDISVHAKTVNLTQGALIQAGTPSTTAAGGNVTIDADSVDISSTSRISSQASHSDAGEVAITANTLTLNTGSITTQTVSEGRGGNVVVDVGVGTVSLSNGAQINSSTTGSGRAGDITIGAGTVSLTGGSKISSASTGIDPTTNLDGTTEPPGTAGNIAITATGSFTSNASTVATSAEANHGGDVLITAQNVQLANGTQINASSNAPLQVTKLVLDGNGQLVEQVVGDGNAGNITINSASNFTMQNSSMTTKAEHASGGQIIVNAPDTVQLINSHIITSVEGSSADTTGGNISIDPQSVILQDSQVLAQALAGTGGNITITSNVFLADPNSLVDASSALGISGAVDIRSPVSNISGVIGRLPESVLATQTILRAACAGRLAEAKLSSFVERQRDHIPVGPEGLLATPYVRPSVEPSIGTSPGQLSLGGSSEIQVRRLMGRDLTPPVVLLSGGTACHS